MSSCNIDSSCVKGVCLHDPHNTLVSQGHSVTDATGSVEQLISDDFSSHWSLMSSFAASQLLVVSVETRGKLTFFVSVQGAAMT